MPLPSSAHMPRCLEIAVVIGSALAPSNQSRVMTAPRVQLGPRETLEPRGTRVIEAIRAQQGPLARRVLSVLRAPLAPRAFKAQLAVMAVMA